MLSGASCQGGNALPRAGVALRGHRVIKGITLSRVSHCRGQASCQEGCSMTATGAVVLNNGHRPMLSDDGRGTTWMECLTHWMAENNLCGGRQTKSFILPAKKQLADSQEVVPNTWDTIRQKRQICKCASCEKRKSKKGRLADRSSQIWKSGTPYCPLVVGNSKNNDDLSHNTIRYLIEEVVEFSQTYAH